MQTDHEPRAILRRADEDCHTRCSTLVPSTNTSRSERLHSLAIRSRIPRLNEAARRWMSVCVLPLGMLFAPTSLARAKVVQLAYEVDDDLDCPTESEFRSDVKRRLGSDPFGDSAASTVSVTFRGTKRGPTSQIRWHDPRGTLPGVRNFEPKAQSCRALATQVVFAVVVQIQLLPEYRDESPPEDESASSRSSAVEPDAEERPVAPPPKPLPNFEERPAQATNRLVDEWTIGAGALGLLGWSPRVGVGARLFVAARQHSFLLEGAAEWAVPSRVEKGGGSGYELSTWSGALAPCLVLQQLAACGVVRVGRVNSRGFGLDQTRSPRAFVSQVGARLAYLQPLTAQWLLIAQGEIAGNLRPVRVELDRAEVWSAPLVTASFGLSVAASFR